uniref:Uncharacterized protein n=1 Tax=Anopheles quadriannulatus TaxID=34691 RepID=A0A182XRV0_ANOQN
MYLPLPLYTFKLTFIAGFSVEWREENGKQKPSSGVKTKNNKKNIGCCKNTEGKLFDHRDLRDTRASLCCSIQAAVACKERQLSNSPLISGPCCVTGIALDGS